VREMSFSILLQHKETGRIVNQIFEYADIFDGTAKDEIGKLQGYAVIARRQCTGLYDQNSQEIYEGDIVVTSNSQKYDYPSEDEFRGIVTYDEQKAMYTIVQAHDSYHPALSNHYIDSIEVVGNIYENPDLLEVKS